MRDWLSAADLAALGLPGLPATKQGWLDYAEREGWLTRKGHSGQPLARVVKGRGGERIEYHIDLLPPVSLAGYVARHVGAVDVAAEDARAGEGGLTIAAQEARDARIALIRAADRLARE